MAIAVVLAAWWARPAGSVRGLPRTFVWAWERAEDVRFLDPKDTGVAFLARTVFLRNGQVTVQPRRNPLRYTPGSVLMAVVRVDADHGPMPQTADAARAVAEAGELPGVRAVQVDFDATKSQRDFYRQVLSGVRSRLRRDQQLSVTALASWCEADHWIDGLPVDEAVPMLFRMGAGERVPERFRPSLCRASAGISLDEPVPVPRGVERVYVFSPRPWTRADYLTVMREVGR